MASQERRVRAAVVVVVLACACAAGCGGGEGAADDGPTGSEMTGATSSFDMARGRQQVVATMRGLRTAFNTSDGAAFCARVTAEGQRKVREFGRSVPQLPNADCDQVISEYSRRVVAGGGRQPPVRVEEVRVDGQAARIVLSGGIAGGGRLAFQMERDDDAWKIVNPISGGKTQVD